MMLHGLPGWVRKNDLEKTPFRKANKTMLRVINAEENQIPKCVKAVAKKIGKVIVDREDEPPIMSTFTLCENPLILQ
jgi:hypothetical protein